MLLCRRLRESGEAVVAVARPGSPALATRGRALAELGCTLVEADLAEPQSVQELAARLRPGRIFHLAAAHHSTEAGRNTPDVWRAMVATNFVSTEILARAAADRGTGGALVYASSSQIWTAREPHQRVDETTRAEPATFYGHTKLWAADLLRQYREHYGLAASVAILFNHESALRSPGFVTRKISMAAARAASGDPQKLQLLNIGAAVDWQAASDVVDALLLMAGATRADDYVIASGTAHTVRDFADAAYRHVGLDWREFVVAARDEPGNALIGLPGKAQRELKWRPRIHFDALVASMVDADVARLRGGVPE